MNTAVGFAHRPRCNCRDCAEMRAEAREAAIDDGLDEWLTHHRATLHAWWATVPECDRIYADRLDWDDPISVMEVIYEQSSDWPDRIDRIYEEGSRIQRGEFLEVTPW